MTIDNTGFVKVEVLQAKNTKVLAINGIRVSKEKGYGMMTVIAKFEVAISDIREILDKEIVN